MGVEEFFTEQPSAVAAELAANHGLGQWRQTFATKQGWTARRWREWRLYIYAGGVVVTAPTGIQAAYDWKSMRVVQYLRTINGGQADAKYALIDPAGAALAIGTGGFPLLRKERETAGITELTHGAPFPYPLDWGPHIQNAVAQTQLPEVLARLERGESVNFGPYEAGRAGITGQTRRGRAETPWSDITVIKVRDGAVFFNPERGIRADPHRKGPDYAQLCQIPNVELFLRLCRTLSPVKG
ncbi:hypothetical protein KPP03845_107424 [Streptomyces xanthophaeus]|nr:hypothetical protein KPP03845_107424 [Streptomyces xanthophaeus]